MCSLCCFTNVAFARDDPGPDDSSNTSWIQGDVGNLLIMLQGMVRLARIVMMFVAALLGIICGVMWYTGQQQAQGMLQKFFVAVFFIFGATAILDAILGMTVGGVTYKKGPQMAEGLDCNWAGENHMGECS